MLSGPSNPPAQDPNVRRRVALLGPLPPFRGGIAQHTTRLMGALREHADLLAISFVRQYPSWLFPGQSDREPNAAPLDLPDCHYLIDSLNPMSWRRAVS